MKINPTNDSECKEISDRLARGSGSPSNRVRIRSNRSAPRLDRENRDLRSVAERSIKLTAEAFDAAKVAADSQGDQRRPI